MGCILPGVLIDPALKVELPWHAIPTPPNLLKPRPLVNADSVT